MNTKLAIGLLVVIAAVWWLQPPDEVADVIAPNVVKPRPTEPERKPLLPRPKPPCPNCPRDSGVPVGADESDPSKHAMFVPSEIRRLCRNPDGSCVQCSGSMCGYDQNYPEASTLLWDTDYGKAERGGGWPERTSKYAASRGMRIFNITGDPVYEWMAWATKTGRGAAIGAGGSHFQTLYGFTPADGKYFVCNNNSTDRIDAYDTAGFKRLHEASGKWIWVLDVPPNPGPLRWVEWWK